MVADAPTASPSSTGAFDATAAATQAGQNMAAEEDTGLVFDHLLAFSAHCTLNTCDSHVTTVAA